MNVFPLLVDRLLGSNFLVDATLYGLRASQNFFGIMMSRSCCFRAGGAGSRCFSASWGSYDVFFLPMGASDWEIPLSLSSERFVTLLRLVTVRHHKMLLLHGL